MIKWHKKARNAIWRFATRKMEVGQKMPSWAIYLFAVLYPTMALKVRLCRNSGYDWERDIWKIEGREYSADVFRWLALADGEVFRITTKNDITTFEKLKSTHSKPHQVK